MKRPTVEQVRALDDAHLSALLAELGALREVKARILAYMRADCSGSHVKKYGASIALITAINEAEAYEDEAK